jgi:hypothetical protein
MLYSQTFCSSRNLLAHDIFLLYTDTSLPNWKHSCVNQACLLRLPPTRADRQAGPMYSYRPTVQYSKVQYNIIQYSTVFNDEPSQHFATHLQLNCVLQTGGLAYSPYLCSVYYRYKGSVPPPTGELDVDTRASCQPNVYYV